MIDMKIYFEDGKLKDDNEIQREIPHEINLVLNAEYGFSFCKLALWKLQQTNNRATVYTNMITALNNDYAWNEEMDVPEIYIRNDDGKFTRIDKLTKRALRKAHNIMRMYMAGAFRNEV